MVAQTATGSCVGLWKSHGIALLLFGFRCRKKSYLRRGDRFLLTWLRWRLGSYPRRFIFLTAAEVLTVATPGTGRRITTHISSRIRRVNVLTAVRLPLERESKPNWRRPLRFQLGGELGFPFLLTPVLTLRTVFTPVALRPQKVAVFAGPRLCRFTLTRTMCSAVIAPNMGAGKTAIPGICGRHLTFEQSASRQLETRTLTHGKNSVLKSREGTMF